MNRDNKKGSATADQSFAEPNNSVNNAIHSLSQAKLNCQTKKVIKEWLDSIIDCLDLLKSLRVTNVGEIELCFLEKDKSLDRLHIRSECIQQLAEAVGETLEEEFILANGYEIYCYRFFYRLKEVFAVNHERLPGFGEENNSEE